MTGVDGGMLSPAAALEELQGLLTGGVSSVSGLVDGDRTESLPGETTSAGDAEVVERVQLGLIRACSVHAGGEVDLRAVLNTAGVAPEMLEQMVSRGDWGPRWMEKLKMYYWTVQLPKYVESLRGSALGGSWRHFELLAKLFGEDGEGRQEQWRKLVEGMEGASDAEVLRAAEASVAELEELISTLRGGRVVSDEAKALTDRVEREVSGGGAAATEA
jgi:hypothetical protein